MIILYSFLLVYIIIILNMCKIKSDRSCTDKASTDHPTEFGYGDSPTGPENWAMMFKECGGKNQSPINLDMTDLETTKVAPLQWGAAYFNTPKTMFLTNTNHSVKLTATFTEGCQPKLFGGCLEQNYVFSEIHFHWGSRDSKGSEHTIDEFTYPMEMHVIHSGTERSSETAKELVILAYFFQISEKECSTMDKVVNVFHKAIKHPFKPIAIKAPFHLASLIQPFSSEYATYKGSLTTPPCTEGMRWIVYPYPLDITKKQIETFRTVCRYAPHMVNNYRPVQPLYDRKVYFVT